MSCVTICLTGRHAGSITSVPLGRMAMTQELSMSPRPGIHGHALTVYVGNGGFSLRRIAACRHLLAEFPEEAACWRQTGANEDMFFAVFGQLSRQFALPTLRVAAQFYLGDALAAHPMPCVRGSCRWRSTAIANTTLISSLTPSCPPLLV